MYVHKTVLSLYKNCKHILCEKIEKVEDGYQFKVNLQINVIWQFFQAYKIGINKNIKK